MGALHPDGKSPEQWKKEAQKAIQTESRNTKKHTTLVRQGTAGFLDTHGTFADFTGGEDIITIEVPLHDGAWTIDAWAKVSSVDTPDGDPGWRILLAGPGAGEFDISESPSATAVLDEVLHAPSINVLAGPNIGGVTLHISSNWTAVSSVIDWRITGLRCAAVL